MSWNPPPAGYHQYPPGAPQSSYSYNGPPPHQQQAPNPHSQNQQPYYHRLPSMPQLAPANSQPQQLQRMGTGGPSYAMPAQSAPQFSDMSQPPYRPGTPQAQPQPSYQGAVQRPLVSAISTSRIVQYSSAPPPPPGPPVPSHVRPSSAAPSPLRGPPRMPGRPMEIIDVDAMDDNSNGRGGQRMGTPRQMPPPPPRMPPPMGLSGYDQGPLQPRNAPPPLMVRNTSGGSSSGGTPSSYPPLRTSSFGGGPMTTGTPSTAPQFSFAPNQPPPRPIGSTPSSGSFTYAPQVGGGGGNYAAPYGAPSAPSPASNVRMLDASNFPSAPTGGGGYARVDSMSKPTSPSYGVGGGTYANPTGSIPARQQLPISTPSFRPGEKRDRDDGPPPPPSVAPPLAPSGGSYYTNYRPQVQPPVSNAPSNGYKLPAPPAPIDFSRNGSATGFGNPPPPPTQPPQPSYADQRTQMLLQRYSTEDSEARRLMLTRLSFASRLQNSSASSTPMATPRRFGASTANRFASPTAVTAKLPPPPVAQPLSAYRPGGAASPHGRLQPAIVTRQRTLSSSSLGSSFSTPRGMPGKILLSTTEGVSSADLARLASAPDQSRALVPSVLALQLASTTTAINAYEKFGTTISESDRQYYKRERVRIRTVSNNSSKAMVMMDLTHRLIALNRRALESQAKNNGQPPPPTSAPYSSAPRTPPPADRHSTFVRSGAKLVSTGARGTHMASAATAGRIAKGARKASANLFLIDGSFAAHRKLQAAQRVKELRHHINYRYELPKIEPTTTKPEVMVVDTCAIMNMTQDQLQSLTLKLDKIELAIPYLVINELDGINKNRTNPEKQTKAKLSREWLLQMQEADLVRIQRREEVDASVEATADNNDDRILAFAVFVLKEETSKGESRRPLRLLTDDRTFRVKAQAERLVVCDSTELLSGGVNN